MSGVRLVPGTVALIDAELQAAERLAAEIGASLPPDWPPEHHDRATLEHTRDALSDPGSAGWWLHYFVVDGQLAGVGGFVGPPRDGVVEVGYSVVPSLQRRGIATAAVAALIERAHERGAHTVTANTLPELEPSIGVLRKLGFEPAPPARDGVISFRRGLGEVPDA